jgi:ADP-ribosylglycohydrolase
MIKNSFEDAANGCIYGGFIGDSCGSFHEFSSTNIQDMTECMEMPGGGCFRVGPGQITDDGELTLCTI